MSTVPYRWRALVVTGFWANTGTMTVLGVGVMLPSIAADFEVSTASAALIASLFPLALAATFVPGSQLGNMFGHRKVALLASYVEVALLAGVFFMPSFAGFIAIRLLSGVARGMAVPNNQAFAMAMFDQSERGRAVGVHTAMIGVGLLVAPPLAGLLTDTLGWRWVFLISAVVFLALDLTISLTLRGSGEETHKADFKDFDFGGAGLFVLCVTSLLVGIQLVGGEGSALGSYGLVGVSVAIGAVFIRYEWNRRKPVLPVRLFRSRLVSVPLLHNLLFMFINGLQLFLLPVYFIQGLGWSALYAGTVLMAWNVARPFGSIASGVLADRLGAKPVAVVSSTLFGFSTLGIGVFGATGSLAWLVPTLVIAGLTHALFGTANMKSLYGSLPREEIALVPGTMGVGRHIGNSAGIAIASTIFAAMIGENDGTGIAAEAVRAIMAGATVLFFIGMIAAWLVPLWWGRRQRMNGTKQPARSIEAP